MKIATIGGGSSYTPEIIEGFINKKLSGELPVTEIWLADIPAGAEKLEIVGNLAKRMVAKSGAAIDVHLTLDRREALKGAAFVTTQIRVGGMQARIKDERIPLKYGIIGQETNGPGGFAKALRTIPVILELCKEMEELCPDAWLINFTNPSGIVTEAVLKHGNVKALGLCNGSIGMSKMVSNICEARREDTLTLFAGLNHFLYLYKAVVNGNDVMEDIIETMVSGTPRGMVKHQPDLPHWDDGVIRRMNMLPCSYHRMYYYQKSMYDYFRSEADNPERGVRAEVVANVERDLFEKYKDPQLAVKPDELWLRGGAFYSEAAVNLITSIYNDSRDIQVAIVRNNGTLSDLPHNVSVESSAIITRDGAKPLVYGKLPVAERGLVQLQKAFEELTVEAAVTKNYEAALQALTINPLVRDAAVARQILDELLTAHDEYIDLK